MDAAAWTRGLHSAAVGLRDAIRLWLPEAGQPSIYADGAMSGMTPYLQIGLAALTLEQRLADGTNLLELEKGTLDLVYPAKKILAEVKDHVVYELRYSGGAWTDPVDVLEDSTGKIVGFQAPANQRWYPGKVRDVDLACRLRIDKAIELLELSSVVSTKPPPKSRLRGKKTKKHKKSCEATMRDLIQSNPESKGWTIREWRRETGFAVSTIQGTEAWSLLQRAAEVKKAAAQLAANRRHRS